jgi:hypothetical protein
MRVALGSGRIGFLEQPARNATAVRRRTKCFEADFME